MKLTGGEYALTLWGLSEVFVIIVCGTIPALKIIWDRYILGNKAQPTQGRDYPYAVKAYHGGNNERFHLGSHRRNNPNTLLTESLTECIIGSISTTSRGGEANGEIIRSSSSVPENGGITATTEIEVMSERGNRK